MDVYLLFQASSINNDKGIKKKEVQLKCIRQVKNVTIL
jgi:hypothetical protein